MVSQRQLKLSAWYIQNVVVVWSTVKLVYPHNRLVVWTVLLSRGTNGLTFSHGTGLGVEWYRHTTYTSTVRVAYLDMYIYIYIIYIYIYIHVLYMNLIGLVCAQCYFPEVTTAWLIVMVLGSGFSSIVTLLLPVVHELLTCISHLLLILHFFTGMCMRLMQVWKLSLVVLP